MFLLFSSNYKSFLIENAVLSGLAVEYYKVYSEDTIVTPQFMTNNFRGRFLLHMLQKSTTNIIVLK